MQPPQQQQQQQQQHKQQPQQQQQQQPPNESHATTSFAMANPMMQAKKGAAAAKSSRSLVVAPADDTELNTGGGSIGGTVRALRALYQSRSPSTSGSLPSGSALADNQRVMFVGGTRIVAAASTRQVRSPMGQGGAGSRRVGFVPSHASAAVEGENGRA